MMPGNVCEGLAANCHGCTVRDQKEAAVEGTRWSTPKQKKIVHSAAAEALRMDAWAHARRHLLRGAGLVEGLSRAHCM